MIGLKFGWLMVVLSYVLLAAAILQSCASFSDADKARIAAIQGEIVTLVDKVESGELTITQAKEIAAKLQLELEALKGSGYSWAEILVGLLGAFVAGALGVKSPGVIAMIQGVLGAKKATA